jgi:5-methylcytosine-specific restriction endonuclease McrA
VISVPVSMSDTIPFHLSHAFPPTCNGGKSRLERVIEDGCLCGSPSATLTGRKQSNGVMVVALQCDNCGSAKSNGLRRSDFPTFDDFPLFDENKNKIFYEDTFRNRIHEFEDERVLKDIEWKRAYDEFLRSREWADIRKWVIARDEFRCQACGQSRDPYVLRVHHLTYEFGFIPPLWMLQTVCIDCHDRLHADKNGFEDPWCPASIVQE